jgi:hypothetical protein
MVASMVWTMWSFYGLNYAFAYACFHDTSRGHYTWYLVPCNELSLIQGSKKEYNIGAFLPICPVPAELPELKRDQSLKARAHWKLDLNRQKWVIRNTAVRARV